LAGEAVLQIDDGLQRREQHFELLKLLGRIGAECFEVDLLASLESFGQVGDAACQGRVSNGNLGVGIHVVD
jgi:hypothetical protein